MLERLMNLWGCSADRAENIIRNDEQHARLVVSRRAFFGAAAALTAPSMVSSFPQVSVIWYVDPENGNDFFDGKRPDRALASLSELARRGVSDCLLKSKLLPERPYLFRGAFVGGVRWAKVTVYPPNRGELVCFRRS